jgi:anti-sigma regulatory factor (Ser/Thr protein kinase)
MTAKHAPGSDERRVGPSGGPFPRYEEGRRENAEWAGVPLGGHEVVSRLHLRMRPGPEAAGEGRHALDRLDGCVAEEQLDTLRLLVTELITNAVRHGPASHWIELELDVFADAMRAEVVDRGRGFARPETPQPHADRPGGWGLCLVDNLADRWGVERGDLTRVWFEIDRGREPRFAAV